LVFITANASLPLKDRSLIRSGALQVLMSLTDCGLPEVPVSNSPNLSSVGETLTAGDAPTPLSGASLRPPVPLWVITSVASLNFAARGTK
jgi:hypothetical protein